LHDALPISALSVAAVRNCAQAAADRLRTYGRFSHRARRPSVARAGRISGRAPERCAAVALRRPDRRYRSARSGAGRRRRIAAQCAGGSGPACGALGCRARGTHAGLNAALSTTIGAVPSSFAVPFMNVLALKHRLDLYERLMRLDKPIGILLLLWPTLWALWIAADGSPHWTIVVIFVAGTVLMRSAGCVMNDLADADFDGHVERTRERPLATGAVTKGEALALAIALSLIAFVLVLFLNRLTIALSVVALFLAASYPFTKRFFAIPQAYLGIAFGFGIPMAFAAQTNALPAVAWWLL